LLLLFFNFLQYVAPSPIENLLIAHHLVELACVGGRSQPAPHAIIQLSEGPKVKADKEAGRAEMGKELLALLSETVNPQLDQHEQLSFIVVVKDEWLPENGFLTPTQKIKRATIEDAYAPQVEGWYEDKKKVIWYGW
jgi:long-chain acyl-CoA synthetase